MSRVNWKSWRAKKIINSEKSASLKCVRAVIIAILTSSPNLIFISKSKLKDNVESKFHSTLHASTRTSRICRWERAPRMEGLALIWWKQGELT